MGWVWLIPVGKYERMRGQQRGVQVAKPNNGTDSDTERIGLTCNKPSRIRMELRVRDGGKKEGRERGRAMGKFKGKNNRSFRGRFKSPRNLPNSEVGPEPKIKTGTWNRCGIRELAVERRHSSSVDGQRRDTGQGSLVTACHSYLLSITDIGRLSHGLSLF